MEKVVCRRWSDETFITVPGDSLRFRPSAYGVVVHGERMLLIRLPNGKLFFPGGGVEPGETLAGACKREFWEETGHDVWPGERLTFGESFMYFDPKKVAWHCVGLFFICELQSDPDQPLKGIDEELEGRPVWVPLDGLREDDMFDIGADVLRKLREVRGES
ncbi:NUDIX domain-containing protein [Patescibacteria group bacterium]